MLILALVLLTSGVGVYCVGSLATSYMLMQTCAVLYVLLIVAGLAVLLFEVMILPWREQGCETIFDVVRDVKRKLFKL